MDLKDLKVYEGKVDSPDATLSGDEETIVKLIKKELTFAEAAAEVSVSMDGGYLNAHDDSWYFWF